MAFDFGNANEAQRSAISTIDGPLLIIAGPGTGKTYTLVKRIVYLITEKDVLPEEIMIATFTEKAAKELITRITNELYAIGVFVNLNEMYIGTFHSICLRILKDHLEYTRIKKIIGCWIILNSSIWCFKRLIDLGTCLVLMLYLIKSKELGDKPEK